MPDSDIVNHRITNSFVTNGFATITLMTNATLVEIRLNRADIRGTALEAQYERCIQSFTTNDEIIGHDEDLPDDADQFDDFCDWLIEPCAVLIRRLALAQIYNGGIGTTLQEFVFPRSLHCLQLVPAVPEGDCSRLAARHVEADADSTLRITTNLATEPLAGLCLPPSIRRVHATDVCVNPDPSGGYDYTCDIPRRVTVYAEVAGQEEEGEKFFKGIKTRDDFEREVLMLNRMLETGLVGRVNVPRLFGIVISDDGGSAIGMLLAWMPFGLRTLWDDGLRRMENMHPKWERQVRETVRELHAGGISWGDVNPGNIVVDFDFDVWIVDFGGGFIEGFVDRDLAGTKEGDLDGIERVFRRWVQAYDS
ncbi:Protein kinase domain-containing protein [Aspergillus sp. HF37]|nr:Protein kinase domain-containing protein [Aspergillus sp. HF37]